MNDNDKNYSYAAILLTWKDEVQAAPYDAGLALGLTLTCRIALNGGRFEEAKEKLAIARERGLRSLIGLPLGDWDIIERDKSPFWHWEGEDLVIDLYSVYHEDKLLEQKARSAEAGRQSAKARQEKKQHVEQAVEQAVEQHVEQHVEQYNTMNSTNSTNQMEARGLPPNLPPESDAAQPPRTDGRMEAGRGQAVGSEGKPKRPADVEEVERMARMMLPHSMQDDATRIAAAFFDENQARGWIDEDGHPVRNWLNRLRRYCETCAANEPHDVQASPQTDPQDFPRPSVDEVVKKLRRYRSCDSLDEAGLMAKAREFLAWAERRKWQNTAGMQISPRAWNGAFFTSFMGGEYIWR